MQYVVIGGLRQPLISDDWNPRYRAGIRHCAALLAGQNPIDGVTTYAFKDEVLDVESDMWAIAEAVLQMSIPDRQDHGWPDIGWS